MTEFTEKRMTRMRAVKLPCPCNLPPKIATFLVAVFSTVIHLLWTWFLGWAYTYVHRIAISQDQRESNFTLTSVPSYTALLAFFHGSVTLIFGATIIFAITSNRDFLKHISRAIWASWLFTWLLSLAGLVVYIGGDSWATTECALNPSFGPCIWWPRLQILITISVIITLAFDFYAGVVISAFVHSLHPHIFYQDSESEFGDMDEIHFYSDSDSDDEMHEKSSRLHMHPPLMNFHQANGLLPPTPRPRRPSPPSPPPTYVLSDSDASDSERLYDSVPRRKSPSPPRRQRRASPPRQTIASDSESSLTEHEESPKPLNSMGKRRSRERRARW